MVATCGDGRADPLGESDHDNMSLIQGLIISLSVALIAYLTVVLPYWNVESRAKRFRNQYPIHERRIEYVRFDSVKRAAQKEAVRRKIDQLEAAGWVSLGVTPANPLVTIRSWGGGVNVHFIRSSS